MELGIDRQEQDCRVLAERLQVKVEAVFVDNDISASRRSRKRRPGYELLLEAVRAGQVEAVLAYSTSRLTRRPRELEDWIDLAEGGAVRLHTVAAGDLDLMTSMGRMIARMLAAKDAAEADDISERAKRERQQRREQGRWHGGNRPFGWRSDGTTPDDGEHQLIRDAVDALLQGRSLAGVARLWTQETGGTPQGRERWRAGSVRDVLLNPRVAGLLPDERPAVWEAIVPEARWRHLRAVLSDPDRRHERGPTRLLTGIAVCGSCGATVNGGVRRTGAPTYRCSGVRHLDRAGPPVDSYVEAVVLAYLTRERLQAPEGVGDGSDLATRAEGLRARLDEAADLFASGAFTRAQVERSSRALRAELDDVEGRMASTRAASVLSSLPSSEDALAAAWNALDVEGRRAVLLALPVTIRLQPPGRGVRAFDPATVIFDWSKSAGTHSSDHSCYNG